MSDAPIAPSGRNTFVKSYHGAGMAPLAADYIRDPRRFPINRYVSFQTVQKTDGNYLFIDNEEALRYLGTNDGIWPDGNDRPNANTHEFQFKPYRTERRTKGFTLGNIARANADFPIVNTALARELNRAMTHMTARSLETLTTTANWPTGHAVTATAFGGGVLDTSSESDRFVQNLFQEAASFIKRQSDGAIIPQSDLVAVIGQTAWDGIRRSPEVLSWLKNHSAASDALAGDWSGLARMWGIADVVVEDTVFVDDKKEVGEAAERKYILDDSILFLTRSDVKPEGLMGELGTYTVMLYDGEDPNDSEGEQFIRGIKVETFQDDYNKRMEGWYTSNTAEVLTAPFTGMLVTDTLDS